MHTVEIYSTPSCLYCNHAKAFFKKHNIKYAEHNVAKDLEKREEMFRISNQKGVPVTVVEGRKPIVGFDEEYFNDVFKIHS